ncbi:MAG: DUF493 domain-containing protein [Pseudomonadota bacterium]|nr:DUF493 domain-containing protein [Pseudomonadota bacterium]
MNDETVFEFPTDFPIKVMGKNSPKFLGVVTNLISEYAEFDSKHDVYSNKSKNGTFISITVTFLATSREQVDTIYQILQNHEDIMIVF